MTHLYATPAQTRAAAEALAVEDHIGIVPVILLSHIQAMAMNPRANSDTLLIAADALREAASPLAALPIAQALRTLADTLATIAPTRADPIEGGA